MTYPAHDITLWRDFCAWLEAQPYNAVYRVPARFFWLVAVPQHYPAYLVGEQQSKAAKAAALIRQQYPIIYWATGYGWRLRKDYRAALDLLEQDLDLRKEDLAGKDAMIRKEEAPPCSSTPPRLPRATR
jgi:hypothetical protein